MKRTYAPKIRRHVATRADEVHTRPEVGQPNDPHEQEANAMADRVMRMPSEVSEEEKISPMRGNSDVFMMKPKTTDTIRMVPQQSDTVMMKPQSHDFFPMIPTSGRVQMMEEDERVDPKPEDRVNGQEEEEKIQMQTEEEDIQLMEDDEQVRMQTEEEEVSMKEEDDQVSMQQEDEEMVNKKGMSTAAVQPTAGGKRQASQGLTNKINSTKGAGSPLSPETQQELGNKMGADFSSVRIHTDSKAVDMNKELSAKAFAHGKDIYFNQGNYDPGSSNGKHLLAHELTHVMQQRGKEMIQKDQESNENRNTRVEVGFNAFIPNVLNAPVYAQNKAWKKEPSPFSSKLFASDNRSYAQSGTSRISQRGFFEFNGLQLNNRSSIKTVGASEQADPVLKIIGTTPLHPGMDVGGRPITRIVGIKNIVSKTAKDKGQISLISEDGFDGFTMRGEAAYPFSSVAPDIDFNVNALVKLAQIGGDYYLDVVFEGERNNFPAYEAYVVINGAKFYIYKYEVDKDDGPGLINLNTSTDLEVGKRFAI
ncbi:MAG: DUF4157 domain-containing protein [Bacteroidota bacterium]